jgi:tetratricopeptide (TPR) repeat protein
MLSSMLSPRSLRRPDRPRGWRARVAIALVVTTGAYASGVTWPGAARAETPPTDAARAVQLNETGSALYAAGDHAGALSAFLRAYTLVPEPNLLFNIAGCHERLGQRTQAIEYYRWFLGVATANPDGRRRAISALSRLEAEPAQPAPPVQRAPEANESSSAAWPLATLGAGILFAGLGAGLYLDGAHDHNEVTSAPGFGDASGSSTMTEVEAHRLIESGDTKKWVGAIGFGLGGALIATHVALNLWRSSAREAEATSAELRLSPGGCSVAGKF